MMDIKKFKENWGLPEVPDELVKLINFQSTVSSFESYSQGFGVFIGDKTGLKSWSDDALFLGGLHPFAQANCSGSFYAIWNDGTKKPVNEMPIVVFGDEGGVHIVAKNMLQLLHLLTFDIEITVDNEEAYFYRSDKDYEESEDLNKFLKWLKEEFGLEQIQNTLEIITPAQVKYKKEFDKWLEQHCETR